MENTNILKPRLVTKLIKKTGELKTYVYDGAKYNKTYYDSHKEQLLQKSQCDICLGSYPSKGAGKAIHERSKKHQLHLKNKLNINE
jgi:hypothetical protein